MLSEFRHFTPLALIFTQQESMPLWGNIEIPEDSELVTGDVFFVNSFQELSLVQILQISNNNNNHLNT